MVIYSLCRVDWYRVREIHTRPIAYCSVKRGANDACAVTSVSSGIAMCMMSQPTYIKRDGPLAQTSDMIQVCEVRDAGETPLCSINHLWIGGGRDLR